MSQGCWEIDINITLAAHAMSILYIPKTDGDDTLQNGGGYPDVVSNTFGPKHFPCGLMGGASTNACCIQDLLQSYRTTASFETYVTGSSNFSQCPSTLLSSELVDYKAMGDRHSMFLEGKFSGMPNSEVSYVHVGLPVPAERMH
jgi:hypothetical protein